MAQVSSGSVNTTSSYGRYLTLQWSIDSTSISTNTTKIFWKLVGGGDSGYVTCGNFTVTIDGTTVFSSSDRVNVYNDTVIASGYKTLSHNNTGNKTFDVWVQAGIYYFAVNCSGGGSFELPTIPRYATSVQSLKSKTETSITMNWSSDSTIDYVWYSTNNGSNWITAGGVNGKSGSYTIDNLSPDTQYKVRTRVRRKDSQLTTDSATLNVTTYDIPHCTETPNFTIGEEVTLKFYNPLNRLMKVSFIGADETVLSTDETTMTTVTGYNSATFVSKLHATIPNFESGIYKIKVDWDTHSTRTIGGKYTINFDWCRPIFNDFTYKDANTSVTNVTGNDQVLLKGYSNLQVTVSSNNKMVARNSANPNKYIAVIDNLNKSENYSEDDVVIDVGTVMNEGTKRLTVSAYDSRNVFKSLYKDIMVYNYTKPVINIDVSRLNNFEAQTTLKINGTYDEIIIDGTGKNAITMVLYRYKETKGDWTEWTTANTTVTGNKFTCNDVILSLDNTKAFEIEAKVIDRISDGVASGSVDVGEAIFFISTNKKKCYVNRDPIITMNEIYPVGSVFSSDQNVNPSTWLGGEWELVKKYHGGELLGFASMVATGGETCEANTNVSFADTKIGAKTTNITNYVENILVLEGARIKVNPQNIVGMVEAFVSMSGQGGTGLLGLWWHDNNNALPEGVTLIGGHEFLASGPAGANYGGNVNNYIYNVEGNNSFYVNPKFSPYQGTFKPSISGTASCMQIKVYAKAGTTYMWKRIS